MHTGSEAELPDAADVAIAVDGVSAGDDVGGELGRQGVPVHHGGAEKAWRGDRRRDLEFPAVGVGHGCREILAMRKQCYCSNCCRLAASCSCLFAWVLTWREHWGFYRWFPASQFGLVRTAGGHLVRQFRQRSCFSLKS
jgi:hypothetical protein